MDSTLQGKTSHQPAVGSIVAYTFPPDLGMADTEGHSTHSHLWRYKVVALVPALVGRNTELVPQLEPLERVCLPS